MRKDMVMDELEAQWKREDFEYDFACSLVAKCEHVLGHRLSNGERRDLIKDNTTWDSDKVYTFVERMVMDSLAAQWKREES